MSGMRRETISTALFIGFLLVYANTDAWAAIRRGVQPERGGGVSSSLNLRHLLMIPICLAWAAWDGLSTRELGLHAGGIRRSLSWGLMIGAAGSVVIRLFFAFPLIVNGAVTQPDFQGITRTRLVWLLGAQFLVGTAVFEEIAFRGVLHAKLVRLCGVRRALAIGSGVYAAWHVVITWYNLTSSNLPRSLFPLLYAGAMAVLFAAGCLFGVLRHSTGHLGGSIVAHWLMVANIVLAVSRRSKARSPLGRRQG